MTIRKGEDWGSTGPLSTGAPIVDSDRALAELVAAAEPGQAVEAGLTAGDLARTLGAAGTSGDIDWSSDRTRLPIDAGIAIVDGVRFYFVANVVIRRPGWLGPVTVIANAGHLGDWIVAPRGHPNDGRFEVLEADLSLADKLKARPRLRTGSHLPHPGIVVRSKSAGSVDVPPRARVHVDGHSVGGARSVVFEVVPDAAVVVV